MSVFYEYARYTIHSGGNDVFVIKSYILGIRLDKMVEVCASFRTKSQMPFTNGSGSISFCLKHVSHGDTSCIDNELGVAGGDSCIFLSPGHPALTTAYANDCAPLMCFAQQVNGYGRAGDVLLVISTSGKSKNILYAAVTARALGIKVVGLTGGADSPLLPLCDVCIRVPLQETYQIQELHLPIYHCLCLMLEEHFFGE